MEKNIYQYVCPCCGLISGCFNEQLGFIPCWQCIRWYDGADCLFKKKRDINRFDSICTGCMVTKKYLKKKKTNLKRKKKT